MPKTTHMTVKGHYIHCGGSWVEIPTASRDLINQWVRRLLRADGPAMSSFGHERTRTLDHLG